MVSRTVDESERFSFEAFTRHPFFTEVNRWIVERVMCPGRRKIVDLGCGPGAVTKLILERLDDARNATVIGIDPSPSALAKARAAIHSKVVEFMQGSAEWVSRLVSSADAVVFLNAIHLVPDKAQVMAEIRKVLNKGGVSVHHPNIIHGSNANHSPLRRCGLTIRYIPTSTRILTKGGGLTPEGRWPSAFLLRGDAVPGVNDYNPLPKYIPGESMPFRGCELF